MTFIKGQVPWNKGKPVRCNPKNEFQNGHIPWNKDKIGVMPTPWNKGKGGYTTRKKGTAKILICKMCGKNFNKEDLKAKYCSRKCWIQSRIGVPRSKETIRKSLRRRKMSYPEIKLQTIINKYKLPYKFVGDGKFFIERKNPDFININGEKKAIEVYSKTQKDEFRNGGFEGWSRERRAIFAKYGWEIIFMETKQLNDQNILSALGGNVADIVLQGLAIN